MCLAAGPYEVSARTDREVDPAPVQVEVSSGESSSVEMRLSSGTIILIRMTDRKGNLVRCSLEVLDDSGRQVNGLWAYTELMSKLRGGAGLSSTEERVGPLPAGSYTLRATAEDGRDAKRKVTLAGPEERRVRLRLD